MHPLGAGARIHPHEPEAPTSFTPKGAFICSVGWPCWARLPCSRWAAACGDDEESTGSQTASKPDPVAQIDALSGQKTEVVLDPGFVEALGALKLTPAPAGDGIDHQGRRCALPDHRRQRHVLRARHRLAVCAR
jgi:hypothetical protein